MSLYKKVMHFKQRSGFLAHPVYTDTFRQQCQQCQSNINSYDLCQINIYYVFFGSISSVIVLFGSCDCNTVQMLDMQGHFQGTHQNNLPSFLHTVNFPLIFTHSIHLQCNLCAKKNTSTPLKFVS